MKLPGDSQAASVAARSTTRILGGVTAFVAVGGVTYYAHVIGLSWLVFVLFGVGLLYMVWAGIGRLFETKEAPTEILEEGFPDEEPEPDALPPVPVPDPRLDGIRTKVTAELIWGNVEPEIGALAEALAATSGNFAEHYIKLRTAQLLEEIPEDAEAKQRQS
jgi:hypothetical protein